MDINDESYENSVVNDANGYEADTHNDDMTKELKKSFTKAFGTMKEKAGTLSESFGNNAKQTFDKSTEFAIKSKEAVIKAIDQNGDGEVDVEDIIILGLKTPGVRIKRADFLQKELFKNYSQEVIENAITSTPAKAGIDREDIDKIADEVIKFERNCVSGISAALGMPGGAAMAATIPADIAQYYGYMLRATQKLLYLYGFPEINLEEKGQKFDSETLNILTICLGVMYGAAGANNAIKAMARALGMGVEKQLLRRALTKGTLYPIVKSIAKWFGQNMTKQIFAGFFKNAIPVIGGVIGGGLTFATFKPCCDKLKNSLQDTLLSNPDHVASKEEEEIIIDGDIEEIDLEEI